MRREPVDDQRQHEDADQGQHILSDRRSSRLDHRRPIGDAERAVAEQQPADGARDGRDGGEDQDPSAEYLADAGLLRVDPPPFDLRFRSEEHTSELLSLMSTSDAVSLLKKKKEK